MKIVRSLGIIALSIAVLGIAGVAGATEKGKFDLGKREYMNRCAVCHGPSGTGDGGAIDVLKTTPTNLTTLSKKNGGVFPFDRVYSVIDGRTVVKGHGTQDMPIWGRDLSMETVKADEHYFDMPYNMETVRAALEFINEKLGKRPVLGVVCLPRSTAGQEQFS